MRKARCRREQVVLCRKGDGLHSVRHDRRLFLISHHSDYCWKNPTTALHSKFLDLEVMAAPLPLRLTSMLRIIKYWFKFLLPIHITTIYTTLSYIHIMQCHLLGTHTILHSFIITLGLTQYLLLYSYRELFNLLVHLQERIMLLSSSVSRFSAKVIGWLSLFQVKKAKTFNFPHTNHGEFKHYCKFAVMFLNIILSLHFHSWRIIKCFYYFFQLGICQGFEMANFHCETVIMFFRTSFNQNCVRKWSHRFLESIFQF